MGKMTLEINGERQEIPFVANARELLQFLGITEDRVALEVNHKIIRRDDRDFTPISDGDRVEIVQFVGGG